MSLREPGTLGGEIDRELLDPLDAGPAAQAPRPPVGARLASVPPNVFAIAFGFAGLGLAWRAAEPVLATPGWVADACFLCGAAVWAVLTAGLVLRLARTPRAVLAELRDPVLSPFMVVPGIVVLVLAAGLLPHAAGVAEVVAITALVAVVGVAGWMTGQWIAGPVALAQVHPAWFLPTVAGGFLGANVCAASGHTTLAWLSFGIGALGWAQLAPLILARLVVGPPLAPALVPTLAIEVAPPAVGGNAYFALHPGAPDVVTYVLAGFCALSVLVQLRLAPVFLRLRFGPTTWAFTFSYAAVAAYALHWLGRTQPGQERLLGWLVLGAITGLVGVVAAKTARAVAAHRFFPAPAVAPGQPADGALPPAHSSAAA